MNITLDAVIFQKQVRGGISRIFYEILPKLPVVDPNLYVKLLIDPHNGTLL